jgi:hypothetical protein
VEQGFLGLNEDRAEVSEVRYGVAFGWCAVALAIVVAGGELPGELELVGHVSWEYGRARGCRKNGKSKVYR